MTQYAKGDTVYLIDGTECEFITSFGRGRQFLVNVILLSGHDEELIVDPTIVTQIFPEPPTPKRAKQIEALDQEIAKREKEISRLQHEQRDIEIRARHFNDLIKRNEALQFVEAFLENRITHLVVVTEYHKIHILPFQEAIKADMRYDSGLKLLSLFGKSGGNLQWRLHKYSTEGDPEDVYPFFSFESARSFAQTKINELTAGAVVDKSSYILENALASVEEINKISEVKVTVPDFVADYVRKQRERQLEQRKEKLLEELREIERKLGK